MEFTLEQLVSASKEHPFYCSDRNCLSVEPTEKYNNFNLFLDEYRDADMDFNLVFRWDLTLDVAGTYCLAVFFIQQRRGHFVPVEVNNITDGDAQGISEYLNRCAAKITDLWKPLILDPLA